jgi:hypothetical protein
MLLLLLLMQLLLRPSTATAAAQAVANDTSERICLRCYSSVHDSSHILLLPR